MLGSLGGTAGECAGRASVQHDVCPLQPSVPLFVPEGKTREEVGAATVVNPALRQSHVTAPWVQEFTDARAQATADEAAAADKQTLQVRETRFPQPTKRTPKPSLEPLPLLRLDSTS
ncbi:unnamed protein product [Phytophthora fragariaefolia]|uniref:Unnamed protein product n=1 Tax=Phytophthora fragariaefolia TaxID=1490495 RepID=A0A9W7D6S6_9STRA|nr:unnamed protein product [Phytophthora fragariaefolia]